MGLQASSSLIELYLNHVCRNRDHFGASVYSKVVWLPWGLSCESGTPVTGVKDCCAVFVGSKPSWWRSHDTDHPSFLTTGGWQSWSVMFLCTLSTAPGNGPTSNGTLMIALCSFSGQKLLSSVLQLQWWLMNWSCKPLSHPFIQDLFQTVGDTDLLWIWMIQGGIYQPSDTYTSTCVEWYKASQSAIAVGESSLVYDQSSHSPCLSMESHQHPSPGGMSGWDAWALCTRVAPKQRSFLHVTTWSNRLSCRLLSVWWEPVCPHARLVFFTSARKSKEDNMDSG